MYEGNRCVAVKYAPPPPSAADDAASRDIIFFIDYIAFTPDTLLTLTLDITRHLRRHATDVTPPHFMPS